MDAIRLDAAIDADIDVIMSWLPTAEDVDRWGGPGFRFPFTRTTFVEDSCWRTMQTRVLRDGGEPVAFGQFYVRYDRINLARLIVSPEHRGRRLGSMLVDALLDESRDSYPHDEYSLFVYRDNLPALRCYQACGFEIQEYPDGAPMPDECYYLTRPVNRGDQHAS